MGQVIELLEAGSQTFLMQTQSRWPKELVSGIGPIDSLLNIDINMFVMGPEDQWAWRSQVVLKELQHCTELLHRLTTLVRIRPNSGHVGTSDSSRDLEGCYDGLEKRLRALCDQIKGSRSHEPERWTGL